MRVLQNVSLIIVTVASLIAGQAFAATVYAVDYAADFSNAHYPGLNGLPSAFVIEGRYTFEDAEPFSTSASEALYGVLSHEVWVNGLAIETTDQWPRRIIVGNDSVSYGDTGNGPQIRLHDYYSTFVSVNNYELAPNIFLTGVGPTFRDGSPNPNHSIFTNTDLPLSYAALSGFPDQYLKIGYIGDFGSSSALTGNSAPLTRFDFTQIFPDPLPGCIPSGGRPPKCDPPVSVVPLPAALPLFLTALGAMGLLGWRRRKAAAAV